MMYLIKRAGTYVASVQAQGKVSSKIMDSETVTMTFSLPHITNFEIGDNVVIYGRLYRLNKKPVTTKTATDRWSYQLEFESVKYELGKIMFMFPDGENNLTVGDFSVNANASTIISLIVQNANRVQTGWNVGTISNTDVQNFTFTGQNLLAALVMLAEAFDQEFWIDENRAIHFQKRNVSTGLILKYGRNEGLHSITRSTLEESRVITRLYAFGSDKNISNGYRNGAPRLRLPDHYVQANTTSYGIIEHTEIFEDIFPHRVGTITHVVGDNPLKFRDTSIDFNLGATLPNSTLISRMSAGRIRTSFQDIELAINFNPENIEVVQFVNDQNNTPVSMLMPGIAAKVSFKTGQLAGYTFDIAAGGWNNSTKEITLVKNTDEKALDLPNDLLRPAVGDKYVITDIIMPESYVLAAEAALLAQAQAYLNKHSRPQVKYAVVTDHLYLRRNNIQLNIGDTIRFIDNQLGLDNHLRITSLIQDLQNPYDVQFELSEQARVRQLVLDAILEINNRTKMLVTNRRNVDNTRLNNIQITDTRNRFSRIGNLDLIPGKGTLIDSTLELDSLKIPINAPIRTIDQPKINKWDLGESQFRLDMTANPLQVYTNIVKRN